jgi:hypothetical protein
VPGGKNSEGRFAGCFAGIDPARIVVFDDPADITL